jgi:hypothetical protein
MSDCKRMQIPYLTFVDDLGNKYPVFSFSGINDKNGKPLDGYFAAHLLNEEKGAEPGNIGAFIGINNGWSSDQMIVDNRKYGKHMRFLGPYNFQPPNHISYDREDIEILKRDFNGRTAEATRYGNGYLIEEDGSGFIFVDVNVIFRKNLEITVYKNEELDEYLLPLNKNGNWAKCLIISSEEFNKTVNIIKKNKMKNGTEIV